MCVYKRIFFLSFLLLAIALPGHSSLADTKKLLAAVTGLCARLLGGNQTPVVSLSLGDFLTRYRTDTLPEAFSVNPTPTNEVVSFLYTPDGDTQPKYIYGRVLRVKAIGGGGHEIHFLSFLERTTVTIKINADQILDRTYQDKNTREIFLEALTPAKGKRTSFVRLAHYASGKKEQVEGRLITITTHAQGTCDIVLEDNLKRQIKINLNMIDLSFREIHDIVDRTLTPQESAIRNQLISAKDKKLEVSFRALAPFPPERGYQGLFGFIGDIQVGTDGDYYVYLRNSPDPKESQPRIFPLRHIDLDSLSLGPIIKTKYEDEVQSFNTFQTAYKEKLPVVFGIQTQRGAWSSVRILQGRIQDIRGYNQSTILRITLDSGQVISVYMSQIVHEFVKILSIIKEAPRSDIEDTLLIKLRDAQKHNAQISLKPHGLDNEELVTGTIDSLELGVNGVYWFEVKLLHSDVVLRFRLNHSKLYSQEIEFPDESAPLDTPAP